MVAWTVILIHLASLEVLGQPYLAPVVPLRLSGWRDLFVRLPYSRRKRRARS